MRAGKQAAIIELLFKRLALGMAACAWPGLSASAHPAKPQLHRIPEVSMIRLISDPEEFDGKWIRMTGFLSIQFELDAVYVSKEAAQMNSEMDAVWLDLSNDEARLYRGDHRRFGILTGLFHAEHCGDNVPCFSGNLSHVEIVPIGPQDKDFRMMIPGIIE
jgi:hypothetical protein